MTGKNDDLLRIPALLCESQLEGQVLLHLLGQPHELELGEGGLHHPGGGGLAVKVQGYGSDRIMDPSIFSILNQ